MNQHRWVAVAEFKAMFEAEFAASRLESAGIEARINQDETAGVFGPGFAGAGVRGVQLLVPTAEIEAAREALDLEDTP